MQWEKLLFLHWSLPPAALSPLLPPGVTLETHHGAAWLGIVPFVMRHVRPRFLPSVPGISGFPELNVRTYVNVDGVPGVWFFSLEAANPLAVRLARSGFHLPYFNARMRARVDGGEVRFQSRRTHHRAAPAGFSARYRPVSGTPDADAGLTHFLTARYCLYSAHRKGQLYRADIFHAPWRLGRAEVELNVSPNAMTLPLGLRLPASPPLIHYAERTVVRAGLPYRV